MKYILMVILIILICYIGNGLSKYYIDRYNFFSSIKEFLQNYKSNISFEKNVISDFIKSAKNKTQNRNLIFILNNFNDIKSNKNNLSEIKFLSGEEKYKLINILRELGTSDSETEREKTEQYISNFDEIIAKTKDEKDKFAPMSFKLSLLLGLAIAILFL